MQSFISIMYCLLFVSATVLLTLGTYHLFTRWWSKKYRPTNNEFTGIMFGAVSLIYSLIIAFVIVAVWDDYEQLHETIEQETDKLHDVAVHSDIVPDTLQDSIRSALILYCQHVIDNWGDIDTMQTTNLSGLRHHLLQASLQNNAQTGILSLLDTDLCNIRDLRTDRISHIRSHVPSLVWLILLTGSAMMIFFSFFVHTESAMLKLISISFISVLVGMSLFLVYALDHPFTSNMKVSNKPYQRILLQIQGAK